MTLKEELKEGRDIHNQWTKQQNSWEISSDISARTSSIVAKNDDFIPNFREKFPEKDKKYMELLIKAHILHPKQVEEAYKIDWEITYSWLKALQKFLILYYSDFSSLILVAKKNKEKITELLYKKHIGNVLKEIDNLPENKLFCRKVHKKILPNKTPHEQLWYEEDWIKVKKYKNSGIYGYIYNRDFPDLFDKNTEKKYLDLRWKERWKYIYTVLWTIPDKIKEALLDLNINKNSDDINLMKDIVKVEQVKESLLELPIPLLDNVLSYLEDYIIKLKSVEEYFKDYINAPKELFSKVTWISQDTVNGEISMEKNLANITFYIWDEKDYVYLYEKLSWKKPLNLWWFFPTHYIEIWDLTWCFNFIYGIKWKKLPTEKAIEHENTHSEDYKIMPDYRSLDILSKTKDELLAHLIEWKKKSETLGNLHWYYDYYAKYKEPESSPTYPWDKYLKLRKLYEQELAYIIEVAYAMKKLNIPNYFEILRLTPVREWKFLKKVFLE